MRPPPLPCGPGVWMCRCACLGTAGGAVTPRKGQGRPRASVHAAPEPLRNHLTQAAIRDPLPCSCDFWMLIFALEHKAHERRLRLPPSRARVATPAPLSWDLIRSRTFCINWAVTLAPSQHLAGIYCTQLWDRGVHRFVLTRARPISRGEPPPHMCEDMAQPLTGPEGDRTDLG